MTSLPQYSSPQAHERLPQLVHSVGQGTFGKSLAEFRERLAIEQLDINPDEVFKDVQDKSPGREIIL